ncbi:hypothetical protein CLIB1444_05S04126 [[Candida] jaroonii]|uniref:Uncharacterized protein n=1 Tax=[Candida] jaroonii TaxID=467808 RepID=A0ACA9Y897_9ASCO|nr:hypothetical protein CLIB1444_05S04126 [[Candida] jaroonii]
MLPRYYNKKLRFYLPILIIIICLLYSVQNILLTKVNQLELDKNSINLHKFSSFNPKFTTSEIIKIINNHENDGQDQETSIIGDENGIWFHWDDYLDTYPGNSILQDVKVDDSPCNCSAEMISYGSVNGYWMESYNKKVLRGMTNVFCIKDIPSKVYLTTDYNMVEIPVKGKKRFGSLLNNDNLLNFENINKESLKLKTLPLKKLSNYKKIDVNDFYFNPDYEIMQLKNQELDEKQKKYLEFLKYANNIVDNSDRYFKYPWIITDVVQGNSHHLAYPFFKRFISIRERQSIIQHLVKSWFEFTEAIDVPSWINYGSLLGWAYNGVNMPWDTDVDVQLPIKSLDYLAQNYNNTLIIENPKFGNGKFFLDISPTYIKQGNGRNFIDGRFIDINSGLYIDLSALSHTNFKPPKDLDEEFEDDILVHCKHFNWHSLAEILPIRHTFFEGSPVYIPNNISSLLSRKYGKESFTTKLHFQNYNYQTDIDLWVADEICDKSPEIDRFTDSSEKELTKEGSCDSPILRDEYRINFESIKRHKLLDSDIDHPIFQDLEDLKLSRKDAWDYFNDINRGVGNGDWFHEY